MSLACTVGLRSFSPAGSIVILCLVYGKNEVGNISEAVKRYLNRLLCEIKHENCNAGIPAIS